MDRKSLLKEWTENLFRKLDQATHGGEELQAITETLTDVFEIGRQTGVDEEKLRVQLSQLGRPHLGNEND